MDSKNILLVIALLAAVVFLVFAFSKFSNTGGSTNQPANDALPEHAAGTLTPPPSADAELKRIYDSLPPAGKNLFYRQSDGLRKPVDPKLVEPDNRIITCASGEAVIKLSAENPNIGGSCTGPGTACTRIRYRTIRPMPRHRTSSSIA